MNFINKKLTNLLFIKKNIYKNKNKQIIYLLANGTLLYS